MLRLSASRQLKGLRVTVVTSRGRPVARGRARGLRASISIRLRPGRARLRVAYLDAGQRRLTNDVRILVR
jgi:hypothetical protein